MAVAKQATISVTLCGLNRDAKDPTSRSKPTRSDRTCRPTLEPWAAFGPAWEDTRVKGLAPDSGNQTLSEGPQLLGDTTALNFTPTLASCPWLSLDPPCPCVMADSRNPAGILPSHTCATQAELNGTSRTPKE